MDVIAVVIVYYHEVLIAGGGDSGEAAGLVGVHLAGNLVQINEHGVGTFGDWWGPDVGVKFRLGTGLLQVGFGLVHMTIMHGDGEGKMATYLGANIQRTRVVVETD
jgi:hypothetical protein